MAYTIKQGDTLSAIAKVNNTTPEAIAKSNGITDVNKIYTGQTLNIPTTPTVSTTQLSNPTNTVLPQAQQVMPAQTFQPAVDATLQSAQSYMDMFKLPESSVATERQGLLSKLADTMGLATQRAQEQQTLESQFDVVGKKQLVQDLSSQILANDTQTQTRKLEVGKFGDTTSSQAVAEEARYEREGAIRKLNLSAQLAAAQGNLSLAENNIQNALNLKYDAIDRRIENIKFFLDQNKTDLERSDKESYNKQQLALQEYERKVNEQKAQDEAIQKIAITAGGFGANSAIISRITNARNVNEAIAFATGFLSDPMDRQIKQAQLAKIYTDIAETRGKMTQAAAATPAEGASIAQDALSIANNILNNKEYIKASGRSQNRRDLEARFVGATDYTNLEALATSLKNKLLVVNTPADVKKYFGPQMTESDVRNILSVSTSLDVERQSPAELQKELIKIQGTLQKATGTTPSDATGGEDPLGLF